MRRCTQARPTMRQAPAQAIVEFALAATLIFTLLAAAVDLGLIFFTLQGLRTAAQEGATYGSYPVVVYKNNGVDVYPPNNTSNMSIDRIDFNYPEIVNRVYGSSGERGAGGFANLRDLNGNGQDDQTVDNLHQNWTDPNAYIFIENLKSTTGPPTQSGTYTACSGTTRGRDLQNGGVGCWLRVTVSYEYRFFFPLAPAFGNTVRLRAYHLIPVRSSFYTN